MLSVTVSPSAASRLPQEVIGEIMRHCTRRDAMRAMYVNRAWLVAAEPRIYSSVTLGSKWKELLTKLAQGRGRLVKALNVFDMPAVQAIVEIVALCPRLELLRFACREGIAELAMLRTHSQDVLQVTVCTDNAPQDTEIMQAVTRISREIKREIRLELNTSITALGALPASSLSEFASIGIYLGYDDDSVDFTDSTQAAFVRAANAVAHVTRLDLHVDVAIDDAHYLLQALEPNNIAYLTVSSDHSPIALPAWTPPSSGVQRQIFCIVPPVEDDYDALSLTPTRAQTNIFGRYRGGGDLCIRSSTRRPTLFHRRLLAHAQKFFDRVYFGGE